MRKYYIELQDEPKACGAYCIYMILKYHDIHVELRKIKEKTRMDRNGISIKGMLECLKQYQVEAKAYSCTLEDIQENVKLPCILHLVYNDFGHYVVLYEIKDDEFIIGDPQKGLITMDKEELNKYYSSYMISILHVGRVKEDQEQSYFFFVKEAFINYKDDVFQFLWKGLFISLLGILGSFLFQIIIDYFKEDTHYFYMAVISCAYLFVQICKLTQQKYQSSRFIELQKILDEDYVFESIHNLLNIPRSFTNQEKGQLHSQLLSLYQLSEMNIMLFENVLLNGISIVLFLIGMLLIHPLLTVIVLLCLLAITIYMKYQVPIMKRISQNYLEKYYLHHQSVLEWIESLFVVKRFHQVQRVTHHQKVFQLHADMKLEKENQMILMNTKVSYMIQVCFFIVLLYGLWLFSCFKISLGQVVMFYMLLSSMIPSFLSLVSLFFEYQELKFIYERYKSFQLEEEKKEVIKEPIHRILLDNVSFSYGYRENILSHIDLMIDKTLYIKGNTGSGKSTLLYLLMGNDLRYQGDIYFNDQELRNIDLNSLYEHVGYECQSPTFFHASLYDNFLCDDIEKIEFLLKAFGYLDLMNMAEMILNEDGYPLSQGQRQVVALVRLFVRDYDVYILDEAFSHIDSKTVGRIYRYIVKNYSDKILIMVNHQTKLVNRSDDYVIIDNGNLIKKGD